MKSVLTIICVIILNFYSLSQNQKETNLPQVPCQNPILGAACHQGGDVIMDGNGTLGMSYSNTACGLNYVQASVMTTTRYSPPGTGFPATLNIAGIPVCASIVKAYVWYGASNSGANPSFTFNGTPYNATLIGTGIDKCWSMGGTENYRGDVTASVTGNGAYTFTSAIGANGVDGVTLMVIYSDPNATYQGTIHINDGDITNDNGGASNQTMTGLSVCANSTLGNAFLIVGDMQDNVAPPSHTNTLNGVATSFPNLFWNFDVANSSFVGGQTTSAFGTVPDGAGDCYDWLMMGIYYQTTTCAICTPPPGLTATSTFVDATCGNCNGTATVNPVGGSLPYTFSWNTVPVQTTQTATNLCAGTYIVVVTDATGCLQVSDTVIVGTSGAPVPPVINPAGPFCTVDPAVNLTASTVGGTWSGTGITNAALGTFNPATAGIGSFSIVYTDAGVCGGADTITIVVNSNANATITPVGPYCASDPAVILTAVNPGGVWSGNGITNPATGAFNPATAGVGTHTITYGITGSCGDTATTTITINPDLNATITAAGPFCPLDPSVNLTAVDPGGTWSGIGITNAALGTFDPATAGVGTHTITYTIAGTCGDVQTTNIVVSNALNATITPVGPYCASDPVVILTAVDAGGVWSGNGITNSATGAFNPTTAGTGTHTITYGIAGSCGDTATTTITINPDLNATITAAGPFCPLDPSVNLSAVDPGGTWSGTGITNAALGTFDPATAGVGTHTITYTIAGACGDVQTTNIVVSVASNATITPVGPYCASDPSINLSAVDSGGVWSGNGITNSATGAFNPTTAGAGTHTITYAIAGACGDTATVSILVIPDANATITPVGPLCEIDLPINLVGNDSGGTWSGNGITNAASGTFDPATAGVGTHTITYTIVGACGDAQTTTIIINPQDDATITAVGPFCVSAGAVILTAVTSGGVWSGNGITNPINGTFNPATAGFGTHTITYTTPGACGNTDTVNIIVNPLPIVSFVADTFSLCEIPLQAFTFYNTTDTTGGMVGSTLWNFGDGSTASGDTVSHSYANPGTYDITLTVISTVVAGGCTNTLTKPAYVQVFANPIADFIMNPNPTTMFDPTIHFYDQSYINIVSWTWDFAGLDTNILANPSYTFPEDTGHYQITLTVVDNNGCENTITKTAIVTGEFGIYVPNAFTPDFDNLNDGFFPNGFGISDKNYTFFIFDRWGETIFESQTKFAAWDGTYKGKIVSNGVYVWKLVFTDINGKTHTELGHVSIIK